MFTGAGRRREWSPAQKAKIIAEGYAGQSSVCDVARRHEGEPVIGPTGAGRVMVATRSRWTSARAKADPFSGRCTYSEASAEADLLGRLGRVSLCQTA